MDDSLTVTKNDKVKTGGKFFEIHEANHKAVGGHKKKKDVKIVQNTSEVMSEKVVEKKTTNAVSTSVFVSEQKSPIKIKSSKIHIRTDIFSDDLIDPVNILNELTEEEFDDNAMDVKCATTFEISVKKRKFSTVLVKRYWKSLTSHKKNDQYLAKFRRSFLRSQRSKRLNNLHKLGQILVLKLRIPSVVILMKCWIPPSKRRRKKLMLLLHHLK